MPQIVEGWGRYPRHSAERIEWRRDSELAAHLRTARQAIPRGLGRSYGDSALADTLLSTRRQNCFLGFDEQTGVLCAEAGLALAEILAVCVPRGWFLPVTPGTKFVTLGGAIAADVHGKNHHVAGCFSEHVRCFRLMLPDGRIERVSRETTPDLFAATCGGMGLTGVIVDVELQLIPIESAYVLQRNTAARDLDDAFRQFEAAREVAYSVAWIDCLAGGKNVGRSILFTGEHAKRDQLPQEQRSQPYRAARSLPLDVPFDLPAQTLNSWTVKAFNTLYFARQAARGGSHLATIDSFFYPLDGIGQWNRIYGRQGFVQYQFVLPLARSRDGIQRILELVAKRGSGSFLAVLKLFGPANANWLSFPQEGYTLALDFPATDETFALLRQLDEIVLANNGRLYLAKDARMPGELLRAGYPQLDRFLELKAKLDPERRLASLQWRRLTGEA